MIQLAELRSRCNALAEQFTSLWGRLDLASKEARLEEIEKIISSPDAWNDQEKMTPVLKEKSRVEAEVARYRELQTAYEETQEWLGFVSEGEDDALETLNEQADLLEKLLTQTEMTVLLSGEADHMDALIDIHPGAGGTEAQDWAEMLERMYLRWAESQGFKAEIVDLLPGDEAGIKSVTIRIQGDNAYGLLRGEKGVHRLIRISPFDASGRRQTSFVSVDLIPDAGEIQGIEIKEADLRIDVYRASGAGGQHVNKTESAVRITHIPTGVVVTCEDERSQHKNKARAMKVLASRILQAEQEKQHAAEAAERRSQVGSGDRSERIRTYNFPQGRVTDHRINLTMYSLDRFMEGEIESMVEALASAAQADALKAELGA